MAQYFFPHWLAPPSQIEDRRMRLMEQEVAQKSVSMMRKGVGLAKMKAETERLTKAGMDPETARRNAFLNNADLLFSDNPEAIGRIMDNSAAQEARMQAAQQLQSHRESLLNLKVQAEARLDEKDAWMKDLQHKKLVSDQQLDFLKGQNDQLRLANDLLYKSKSLDIQNAELDLSKAREKRVARRENTQRQVTQKEIETIDKQLADPDTYLTEPQKEALRRRREALFKSLGDEEGEEGAPAPVDTAVEEPPAAEGSKKRLKWNPQSNRIE